MGNPRSYIIVWCDLEGRCGGMILIGDGSDRPSLRLHMTPIIGRIWCSEARRPIAITLKKWKLKYKEISQGVRETKENIYIMVESRRYKYQCSFSYVLRMSFEAEIKKISLRCFEFI